MIERKGEGHFWFITAPSSYFPPGSPDPELSWFLLLRTLSISFLLFIYL
jgi:hypothetical protein